MTVNFAINDRYGIFFSIAKKVGNDFESVNHMNHIDQRTYNHHEMWQRQGKSHKWLNGYDAGFNSKQLSSNLPTRKK